MLFNEDYLRYKFPEPQYLGAKFVLLNWIEKFIPKDCRTVFDAFAGTQSVAFLMKQLGLRVITNDFLQFNHQIGLGLIENKNSLLEKEDVEILFSETNSDSHFLIRDLYTDLFFTKEQAEFLDNFRANIELLKNPYKKALAFASINRNLTRKILMERLSLIISQIYLRNSENNGKWRNSTKNCKAIFAGRKSKRH